MYLEGGGGGGFVESYELAAYFYSRYFDNRSAELPFFFITGDEQFYETVTGKTIKEIFGVDIAKDGKLAAKEMWQDLKKKFNVFHIHKPYYDPKNDAIIKSKWADAVGKEHILEIDNPKAVIDVVLGAIAITSGSRNLQTYIKDMKERGQTQERIDEVTESLKLYDSSYSPSKVVKVAFAPSSNPVISSYYGEEEKKEELPVSSGVLLSQIKADFDKKEKMEFLDFEHREYKKDLKDMKSLFRDKVPEEFFCPITGEIFYDPVMTDDGHTYERNAITTWLDTHETSPITNVRLSSKKLIPNQTLKKLVREFYESNKIAIPK